MEMRAAGTSRNPESISAALSRKTRDFLPPFYGGDWKITSRISSAFDSGKFNKRRNYGADGLYSGRPRPEPVPVFFNDSAARLAGSLTQ